MEPKANGLRNTWRWALKHCEDYFFHLASVSWADLINLCSFCVLDASVIKLK